MTPKKIALTFDYELFLGLDSGTARKTIIEPTNIILDLLVKHKQKGIFFVDALYLLTLKKHSHPDYTRIVEQLKKIVSIGSDIELHIHPQWVDAVPLDKERWTFGKFDTFRLHALSKDELDAMFTSSLEELHHIIHQVNKDYSISAFRAGGWSIQPFDHVKDILVKHGVTTDFSVNPGEYKNHLPEHFFDYRAVSLSKDHWYFSTDPVREDTKGTFLEIPISKVPMSKLYAYLDWKKVTQEPLFSDGKPLMTSKKQTAAAKTPPLSRLFSIVQRKNATLSFEDHTPSFFRKMMKRMKRRPGFLLTGIGHPKNMNKSSVVNIEYLVKNFETVGISDIKTLCSPYNV